MSEGRKAGLVAAAARAEAEGREAETAARAGEVDLLGEPVRPARGPGRPAGALNKTTVEALELIRIKGKSPLEFLLDIMLDERQEAGERRYAAVAALPYCHRKQPVAVELGGTAVTIILPGLTPEALDEASDGLTIEGEFDMSETSMKTGG